MIVWDLQTHTRLQALTGRHKDGVRALLEYVGQEAVLVSAGDVDDAAVTSWTISRGP